jgi:GNAT superfamily N-acetyltransferase
LAGQTRLLQWRRFRREGSQAGGNQVMRQAGRRAGAISRSTASVTESFLSAEVVRPPLQLVRLPVDKPQLAVAFLKARSGGVMDLIAHFWERLAQTPPLQRRELHLVAATPIESDSININIPQLDSDRFSGAMLYVPKAHRADVLALNPPTAAAFASYISHHGSDSAALGWGEGANSSKASSASAGDPSFSANPELKLPPDAAANSSGMNATTLPLTDLSALPRNGRSSDARELPTEPVAGKGSSNGRIAIDFLTGEAEGIGWMTPLLLPLVHKRSPAQQLVNVVMQLPAAAQASPDNSVRLARESDIPTLNRWRRQYKDERGILFDADMDAWVQNQRVFVYELAESGEPPTAPTAGTASVNQVMAVAKIDLELQNLVEIGGVYTFPEHRNHGYGAAIVRDLAWRIRQMGKTPTLQVDEQNAPALRLYESAGWKQMGRLARVWLTG